METVFGRPHHDFGLERERPHQLEGFQTRLAARAVLHNFCIWLNRQLGRPSLAFAGLAGLVAPPISHQAFKRFTAETHAAHLLPYLKTGLRVLDFGCGPGTISAGLAKAVEPGELHGVGIEESQIDLARSVAEAGGQDNATFHVGDVTDLPFEDAFFDVAHCHNVLMHVPDTRAVLTEVKRVLKPGGIVSAREMICESSTGATPHRLHNHKETDASSDYCSSCHHWH